MCHALFPRSRVHSPDNNVEEITRLRGAVIWLALIAITSSGLVQACLLIAAFKYGGLRPWLFGLGI